MKKKKLKNICLVIVICFCVSVVLLFIYHKLYQMYEEKELIKYGVGEQVDVEGKKVNILTVGNLNSDNTIVYMQGLGMGDTLVAAIPMFESLEEKYKICLVDRYGNGMSDDSKEKQTVSKIIDTYRKTLVESNEKSPYILVAHSIAGMYATYWAQQYPEEIKAIIYLDADPAEAYVKEGKADFSEVAFTYVEYIVSKLGFQRFISEDILLGKIESRVYTEQQNRMRKYLMYRHTISKATYSEFKLYYQNAQTVVSGNLKMDIPQLYIVADNVKGEYFDNVYLKTLQERFGEDKEEIQKTVDMRIEIINGKKDIMRNRGNVTIVEVSGPHCIYSYKPNEVSDLIMTFLEK